MLEDENNDRLKKELISKLGEINLFKRNLESNLDLCLLPKIFKKEITEVEKEIRTRKEFELFFQTVVNFLNTKFLSREEKRRKEYKIT